jgi:hypothetical protein
MPDSIRQTLVERVTVRMQSISTANGYETNLGTNVREWVTHLQQEDVPADGLISVCDLVAEADEAPATAKTTGWRTPVHIRFWFPRNMLTAENVRKGIQDINRAIRQDDRWTADGVGLVITSMPSREGPLIPEDSFEMTGGVVEFEVLETRKKFNSEE